MPDEDALIGHDGKPWPQTMDGQVWATTWMQYVTKNPAIAQDKETMLGWFCNSIMAGYDAAQRRWEARARERLSASEAVYGFAAWLTTSPVPITLSALHECGPVVELIREFCHTNHLPEPREEWTSSLRYPGQACDACGGSWMVNRGSTELPDWIECPECPGPR